MEIDSDSLVLQLRLKKMLEATLKPIPYGILARDLNVPGPGAIARVTQALEALMQDDAAAGRPFLAAMCEGKLSGGLPALGFFQMAASLGRYSGSPTGENAVAFVAAQRDMLRKS